MFPIRLDFERGVYALGDAAFPESHVREWSRNRIPYTPPIQRFVSPVLGGVLIFVNLNFWPETKRCSAKAENARTVSFVWGASGEWQFHLRLPVSQRVDESIRFR